MAEDTLRASLAQYGKIVSVKEETWARTYRFAVANGIRQVDMTLTKHFPSHMKIAGHRVLTSYGGQPLTCYGCSAIGRKYHACPNKRGRNKDLNTRITTYEAIAAHGTPSRTESPENRTDGAQTPEQTNMTEGPMVETDEAIHTGHPHLSGDTTEQQTHQYPMLSK